MATRSILGLVVAMLLVCSTAAISQTSRSDPSDLQAWYSAALNLNLPRKWEAGFKYRLRMVDNASAYRGSYLYAEIGREIIDNVSLLSEYRLALADDGTYHRYALGAEGSREVWNTELSFRPIVQYQRQTFVDDDEGDEDLLVRTRLKAERKVSKAVELYGAVEPFFEFGADYPINNWRNTVGLQLEYAKDRKIDLFYIYRPDHAKSYNRTFHVIGVELDFDVKVPRSKKKDVKVPGSKKK